MVVWNRYLRRHCRMLMLHIPLINSKFRFIGFLLPPNGHQVILLDQIETKEHKYPYQVHKVPVQPGFLYHKVMSSFSEHILLGHDQHDRIDNNSRKNVEAVKPCYSEEVAAEGNRAIPADMQ